MTGRLSCRLKHIIEQYADGPGVLLELVQNADDAGASEISFLLDTQTYASNSVLGTATPWHVPCICNVRWTHILPCRMPGRFKWL